MENLKTILNSQYFRYITLVLLGAFVAWASNGKIQLPVPLPPVLVESKGSDGDREKASSSAQQAAQQDAVLAAKKVDWEKMEEPVYICGRNESISDSQSATFKPWPIKNIAWTVKLRAFPGMSESQVLEAFKVAWASWAKEIDIQPVYVEDEKSAHVISQFGPIDGSGKVLAWSELSNGTTTQKHQLYDFAESWERSATPANIDLDRVAAHEIGHVLGLVHDADNSGALMAPIYSRTIRYPTPRDVTRMVELGYPRAVSIPPQPNPAPPVDSSRSISVPVTIREVDLVEALKKAGYKVEK